MMLWVPTMGFLHVLVQISRTVEWVGWTPMTISYWAGKRANLDGVGSTKPDVVLQ